MSRRELHRIASREPEALSRSRLVRAFFETDATSLAAGLLGRVLVRVVRGERIACRIVETEAYVGVRDEASHAFGGRRTGRNASMYAEAGTAYVYFTYGMHWCMNVVCGRVDEPVAVLLRAGEPIEGIGTIRRNRGTARKKPLRDVDLCSGPARLCQGLGIDRALDGVDLVTSESLFLEEGSLISGRRVGRGSRIGLSAEGRWGEARLRFAVRGHPHVSVPIEPQGGGRR